MEKLPVPAPEESLLRLDKQLCFPLYALSRLVTKAYQPLLEKLGVTYPQYLVLLLLWEHNALTVKQLGEKLLLDSGTLTPLLKRMEQHQWLGRQRDPRDERSVIVTLQPAGQALKREACEIPMRVAERLHMGPTEIDLLRTQLCQLIALLT